MAPATSAAILTERLLERGYDVRVLDRLYWGEQPLAALRDRIELVVADVREIPASAFDGVDGVIHLAGLSNDPTAEYDPEANWQMNAVATDALGKACVERGVERVVFSSSCSLYDGLPPGMHDETAPVPAAGRLLDLEALRRAGLLALPGTGPLSGNRPQRNRLRPQLTDAVRPRREHLREGRPRRGALLLHGGGWMWRPLVDVRDAADAMIACYEAPDHLVRGEIFNVLHSNYQIRELAMLVAGSAQLVGCTSGSRRRRAQAHPRLRVLEREALGSAGFIPAPVGGRGGGRPAERRRPQDRSKLTDPRYYNIRWLQLLHEVKPRIEEFGSVL